MGQLTDDDERYILESLEDGWFALVPDVVDDMDMILYDFCQEYGYSVNEVKELLIKYKNKLQIPSQIVDMICGT